MISTTPLSKGLEALLQPDEQIPDGIFDGEGGLPPFASGVVCSGQVPPHRMACWGRITRICSISSRTAGSSQAMASPNEDGKEQINEQDRHRAGDFLLLKTRH